MSETTSVWQRSNRDKFTILWGRYSTVAILVLMIAVFSLVEPIFMSGRNMLQIVDQGSVTILLACGEFFAILLAGIDLSVGSVMALSGVITAQLIGTGLPWPMAMLMGVLSGGLAGFLNGLLISATKLPPFIITLGTMAILRGTTWVLSNARAVPVSNAMYSRVISGRLFTVVPTSLILILILAGFLIFFTTRTKAGRNLYAMGGNPQAAWYAGINITRHTLLAFTISGICAALAGAVNIARLGSAEPNAGTGYETYAIAAVIIGGTSFFGGEGVIWKVLVGGLIIATINNGLNMVGVSAYYQQIAMGALIILAVTLDRFFGPRSGR
ncbi:MAG: D-allose ABC transporter permease [Propionibacteriaceae bacterium]|jgi:D-allose transport system permease protein|nr:D-allose ABC transporter permease [Propionibacteriaceae bacterium]